MTAAINTVLDYFESTIVGLAVTDGRSFRVHKTSKSLESMTSNSGFDRLFEVVSPRNLRSTETYQPLRREGSIFIRIGYLGNKQERLMQRRINEDEELIARTILQSSDPDLPSVLCNLDTISGRPLIDVSDDKRAAFILEIEYAVLIQCAAV